MEVEDGEIFIGDKSFVIDKVRIVVFCICVV